MCLINIEMPKEYKSTNSEHCTGRVDVQAWYLATSPSGRGFDLWNSLLSIKDNNMYPFSLMLPEQKEDAKKRGP